MATVEQTRRAERVGRLQAAVAPLRSRLFEHPLYARMQSLAHLRTFMEHHVWAVWDFMSLLKSLQRELTCVAVPWVPQGDPQIRRMINDIVLAEESDEVLGGRYTSHFEMYLDAMLQCGADTSSIDEFLDRLARGANVGEALEGAGAPAAAKQFVLATWDVIESRSPALVAASFALGREDVIPDMFRRLVNELVQKHPTQLGLYHGYLLRHIHLDEADHAPLAMRMVAQLCADDDATWEAAAEAGRRAIEARIALWNGVVERLR